MQYRRLPADDGLGLQRVFVVALRHLGTARTGAYFPVAPLFGVILSFALWSITTDTVRRREWGKLESTVCILACSPVKFAEA